MKEQYPGFTMILRSSKTHLDLTYPSKNGFILESITQQMIATHLEVKMADDSQDGNGLQSGFLKTGYDELFSNIQIWHGNQ